MNNSGFTRQYKNWKEHDAVAYLEISFEQYIKTISARDQAARGRIAQQYIFIVSGCIRSLTD